jgi:hypothetical protein
VWWEGEYSYCCGYVLLIAQILDCVTANVIHLQFCFPRSYIRKRFTVFSGWTDFLMCYMSAVSSYVVQFLSCHSFYTLDEYIEYSSWKD